MSISARESSEPLHDAAALAMAKLRPVAQVARDLGIRTEVELPGCPASSSGRGRSPTRSA